MNKKHFLRNWALHYTDPSYLYLPMREKQKYKLIGQRYKVNGIFMPEEGYAINKAVVDVDYYMNGAPIYVTDLAQQLQDSTAPKLTLHFGTNNLYYCVVQLNYDWFPTVGFNYGYRRIYPSVHTSLTGTQEFLWWNSFYFYPSELYSFYKVGHNNPLFIFQGGLGNQGNLALYRTDFSKSSANVRQFEATLPYIEEELVSIDSISYNSSTQYISHNITKKRHTRTVQNYEDAYKGYDPEKPSVRYIDSPHGYIEMATSTDTIMTGNGGHQFDPLNQRRVWCSVDEETFMYHRAMIQMELNNKTYYISNTQTDNTDTDTDTRGIEFNQNGVYKSTKAWDTVTINVPTTSNTVYPFFDENNLPHPAHFTKFFEGEMSIRYSYGRYKLWIYRPNTFEPYGQFGTAMSAIWGSNTAPSLAADSSLKTPKYSYSSYYPALPFLAVLMRRDYAHQEQGQPIEYVPIATYWWWVSNASTWATKAINASVGDRSLSGLIDHDSNTGIYSDEATVSRTYERQGIGQFTYSASAIYRWISHWYYYQEDPENDTISTRTTNQRNISYTAPTNFWNYSDTLVRLHVSPIEYMEYLKELNEWTYGETYL